MAPTQRARFDSGAVAGSVLCCVWRGAAAAFSPTSPARMLRRRASPTECFSHGRRDMATLPCWRGFLYVQPTAPTRERVFPQSSVSGAAYCGVSSASSVADHPAPATSAAKEQASDYSGPVPHTKLIDSPLGAYDQLIARGQIANDPFQRSVVRVLEELHESISKHTFPTIAPAATPPDSFLGRVASAVWGNLSGSADSGSPVQYGPRGLYLYGSVGTGKTMLMNLFYDTLHRVRKRRVHFHAFMLDVHMRAHKLKSTTHAQFDPIPSIASDLASQSSVLCFDEFQVTDIADAMILRRLLEELFRRGVVVVTTSNRHPDELYQNGIQRKSFIPCIEFIKERCRVVDLNSGKDYRKMEREAGQVFFTPLGPETTKKLEAKFAELTEGRNVTRKRLKFIGRALEVRKQAGGVAWFTFEELCANPLSAADYLAIAKRYHTVLISDIPRLSLAQRNEARRFVTALDALYESHATVIISSAAGIFDMFSVEDAAASGSSRRNQLTDAQRLMMDDLGLASGSSAMRSPLFSGAEEIFAFQRAISRLAEMGSKEWVERKREARIAAGEDADDQGIEDHGEAAMNLSEEDELNEAETENQSLHVTGRR